jgi:hypothetical protein
MNKEVEEMNKRLARLIIEDKKNIEEIFLNKNKELQAKVNQLETKIDKAIEYITGNMQYDDNIDDYWTTTNELLEILKGGSNE